jgi:hypothetical protein
MTRLLLAGLVLLPILTVIAIVALVFFLVVTPLSWLASVVDKLLWRGR